MKHNKTNINYLENIYQKRILQEQRYTVLNPLLQEQLESNQLRTNVLNAIKTNYSKHIKNISIQFKQDGIKYRNKYLLTFPVQTYMGISKTLDTLHLTNKQVQSNYIKLRFEEEDHYGKTNPVKDNKQAEFNILVEVYVSVKTHKVEFIELTTLGQINNVKLSPSDNLYRFEVTTKIKI
jgi:hypothetical protein